MSKIVDIVVLNDRSLKISDESGQALAGIKQTIDPYYFDCQYQVYTTYNSPWNFKIIGEFKNPFKAAEFLHDFLKKWGYPETNVV